MWHVYIHGINYNYYYLSEQDQEYGPSCVLERSHDFSD